MEAVETPRIQEGLSISDINTLRSQGRLADLTEEEFTALCQDALHAEEEELTDEDREIDALLCKAFIDSGESLDFEETYDENGNPIYYTVEEVFAEVDEMLADMSHMDINKLRLLEETIGTKAMDDLTNKELREMVALL
jgi:hypothetical protein